MLNIKNTIKSALTYFKINVLEDVLWLIMFLCNYDNLNLYLMLFIYIISDICVKLVDYKFNIIQQEKYHDFADKRCICSIKNFGDVISNIIYLVAALYQFYNNQYEHGILIILVCLGSTYYHWEPNRYTIFIDRLPMIFYMNYLIVNILNIHLFIIFGIFSLIVHFKSFNLNKYVVYQLTTIVCVGLHKPIPTLLYCICKYFEDNDILIYNYTNKIISGHTLKHLISGVAMLLL